MKLASYLFIMVFSVWGQFARGAEPLKVVTLSTVLTDFVKNVGGDAVRITPMVKAGQDPHEFNPTVAQMRKMSEAKLIFASGKGMEGYLQKLRDTSKGKTTIVDVGAAVPSIWGEETCDHGHGHHHHHSADGKVEDPHWWHSIPNAITAVKAIRDALIKADPARKNLFEKNAAAYIRQLEELKKMGGCANRPDPEGQANSRHLPRCAGLFWTGLRIQNSCNRRIVHERQPDIEACGGSHSNHQDRARESDFCREYQQSQGATAD